MTTSIQAHEDPVLFREAVNFTAAQTRGIIAGILEIRIIERVIDTVG